MPNLKEKHNWNDMLTAAAALMVLRIVGERIFGAPDHEPTHARLSLFLDPVVKEMRTIDPDFDEWECNRMLMDDVMKRAEFMMSWKIGRD